ncbi:hypothetical protein ACFXAZ_38070 [Streptomyces sp. NPDC059477]|uniref:hypothetical protein n=1 Tax=Streptomyces sp. NPDC059477 TaxID=3346847 RepID=UPI0036ADC239
MRYDLRDPEMLRRIMATPGRGVPFTVRTLASATGLGAGLIGHLLSGRSLSCDMEAAHQIAEALGVAVLVLFVPPTSPDPREPVQMGSMMEEECRHDRAHHLA